MNHELPVVLIKRKNIQSIFEYCMDNKVEFTVREKPFTVEEFEVILDITEIKKAIAFGIFARENKIEVVGVNDQPNPTKNNKRSSAPAPKAPEPELIKSELTDKADEEAIEEEKEDTVFEAAEKTENKPFSLDLSSNSLSFS